MELAVRRIVRSRGEPDQWLSFLEALLWFPYRFCNAMGIYASLGV